MRFPFEFNDSCRDRVDAAEYFTVAFVGHLLSFGDSNINIIEVSFLSSPLSKFFIGVVNTTFAETDGQSAEPLEIHSGPSDIEHILVVGFMVHVDGGEAGQGGWNLLFGRGTLQIV